MIICKEVLTKNACKGILESLKDWEEGQSALGSSHKDNQELKNHPLSETIKEAIISHPDVRKYSFIKYMTQPRFNKYQDQGKYNDHVDFFRQEGIRTDWSMTLFLNDQYEGGELVLQTPYGEQQIKLPAGDMVIYPSGLIHRVNPVTKGERIAAISWAESFVEDHGNREILSTLVDIISDQPSVKLSYVYDNLLRKWSH